MFPDKIPEDLHALVNSEQLKAACCSHAPGRVGNDVSPARMLIFWEFSRL